MFLCRAGRLSAAALDQALRSPGSFLVRVKANRPTDVTLTPDKGRAFLRRRSSCAAAGPVESALAHLVGKRGPDAHPARSREPPPPPPSGFVITDWGHWDLCERVQSEGGSLDIISPPLVRAKGRYGGGGAPVGDVLFTGRRWVSAHRRSAGTMQTRASSTAAAKKEEKKEEESAAGEERTTDKGDKQNLKEDSTTSSSNEKAPGELEPEGGKPSKTQQLKKVFKEYGAVGVSFHIGISLMSLGMFYLLISSGIDMAAMLCRLGFSETVVRSKMAAGTSTFVLAYAIHKLFAPVRISITLVSVPLIVRHFRKTGLFKPPTPAP